MKLVFMGTPDFAAGALKAIVEAGHQVSAVVTQPDRPKGRGKEVQFSPVKEYALSQGLPVFQPTRIKTPEAVEELKKYEAEVYVVAAFGQILSSQILHMPKYGCLNIHASLLPKYRGAAPIQWAIINGEKETGVTIMQMDEGVDTGDMLLQRAIPIEAQDTADSLHDKLMELGAGLIVESLQLLEEGRLTPVKQEEELATHVGKMDKAFGELHFDETAQSLERKVRGLNSWPSAYTFYKGKRLKIWESQAVDCKEAQKALPGTVLEVLKDSILVATKDGALRILQVQQEGKRRMTVKEFLLGCTIKTGERLGKGE